MKKLFGALVLATSIFAISCSNSSGSSDSSSGESNSSSGDTNTEQYEFSDKEHFLVLTNTSNRDIPFTEIPCARGGRQAYVNKTFIQPLEVNSDDIKIIDANFDNLELYEAIKNADINPSVYTGASYSVTPPQNREDVAVNGTYDFWINDSLTNGTIDLTNSIKCTFTLKAVGQTCKIWYRNSAQGKEEPEISDEKFTNLSNALDSVFHKEMAIFGSNEINSNTQVFIQAPAGTKLNVLIYDIGGDKVPAANTATYGGFFAGKDLYLQSIIDNSTPPNNLVKSNTCECIHVDSYLLKRDMDNQKQTTTSTIVHETQHLLHFINKTLKQIQNQNQNPLSETWFNEMLSLCAEDIFQSQLGLTDDESSKNRLPMFNANYYHGFKNWKNGNDVLISYANVYAFGAYLMRNFGGVRLINKIATNNYINEESITQALQALGYTNENFMSVLKKFADVIIYPESNSKYTLNKTVNQTFEGENYSITAINLMNYYINVNESILQNFYDSDNRKRTLNNGTLVMLGPIILKAGIVYNDKSFGGYGTHAIYLGKVNSRPEFVTTADINQAIYFAE